jgi:hypothetical protein
MFGWGTFGPQIVLIEIKAHFSALVRAGFGQSGSCEFDQFVLRPHLMLCHAIS